MPLWAKVLSNLFLTAMRSGGRERELIALQWGDIDWRGKFLEVRWADWSGYLGTPKNGKTRRIDLAERLLEVLADHRKALAADALAKGKAMSEWVFPKQWYYPTKQEARPWDDNLRRMLSTCLKRAGVRSVTFHQLRHSFCAWMIQNGESLVYAKDQAGHSSIKVTVDVYGKLVPGENRAAMNRLGEFLKKSATQAQPKQYCSSNIQQIKGNY